MSDRRSRESPVHRQPDDMTSPPDAFRAAEDQFMFDYWFERRFHPRADSLLSAEREATDRGTLLRLRSLN